MKVAGLFAGIGGLEVGLARAGHVPVLMSEIWQPARAVLKCRYPDIPLPGDIADIEALPADTEIITAGFPCQDLSQAGRTAGIAGTRSGLVGHIFRLIDRRPVPWVVLENVSFMLHLDKGRALRTLVEAFEERGYRWAYRVVNSLAFLPQRRERVIFVATLTDNDPADVICADEVTPPVLETALDTHAHGFYWTEGIRGLGWAQDAVPTLKNGSTVGIPSPPAILLPDGAVITPDIRDAERLQGFEADWTLPAEATGRASLRWSLTGNAVSVPVAEWLGRRLSSPGCFDPAREATLPKDGRWPKAARFDGHARKAITISTFPEFLPREPLAQFLRHPGKPLSERATRGFLSRTQRSTLRFPTGFIDALQLHLSSVEASRVPRKALSIAAE